MRCGRMRCGDIWRCGGKKKGSETGVGNKYLAYTIKYRPQESEFRILMRDNGEDFVAFGDNGITLHGAYANDPQMGVIRDLIISLEDLAQFFMLGAYEGIPAMPTEKEEGFYRDEFMERINDVYNSPTEEKINAFISYLMELLQEIETTGDYNKLPLQVTKSPQYKIDEINLSAHEIDGTDLDAIRLTYTMSPRTANDREEITFDPVDACGSGTYGSGSIYREILRKDAPITVTVAVGEVQDVCIVTFD